ncbi:N-acyl amino acid synthase FeeM domain-containing protein [Massilia pseudoviolaceinigra]|uniref:N-acyl amino acid synthase FeeM domain-containing protein n=1 Tax=Massilia pseudoviolaceinigra TaxID=3057165 RepID=UPI002796BE0C|nr:N-acetyltransferase [Massilia sp. CCM 9206]MDQ1921951.1 N-acetyltransferase [Massilia sp. CCM 9206]
MNAGHDAVEAMGQEQAHLESSYLVRGEEEDHGRLIGSFTDNDRTFGIRLADTDQGRNSASLLISKMYATRGYNVARMERDPNRITLSASDKGSLIGTVTLGLDSERGILADEIFRDHVDAFRARGARLCEITKLAFDPQVKSKAALAALFHTLFIYARHIHGRTDVLIEVNPRHRRFYQTMLGFVDQAELRHNTRVDAPAYLMWLSVEHMAQQIALLGGTSSNPGTERSLYPYFFSPREEEGIANRLIKLG